jgi:hypothetical protein
VPALRVARSGADLLAFWTILPILAVALGIRAVGIVLIAAGALLLHVNLLSPLLRSS